MADDLKPIKKMQIINEGVPSDRYIGADSQDIAVYKKDGKIVSRDTPDAEEIDLNAILSNMTTGGQEQIQFEVMPEPSIDYQGKIYQYIGTNTSSGYTTGSFYQCVLQQSTGQYIWKPLSSSVTFNQRAGGVNNVTNEAATPNALFQTMQKFDEDYVEDGNIVVDIAHGGTGTNDGTINGVRLKKRESDNAMGYIDANGDFRTFRQPTGNATAGDVLRGKTFANANNDNIEGTFTAQEKTVTGSRSQQTVTPDSGYYLSKVTVNKYPDANGVYPATSRGTSLDMGINNNYRYVNTNGVPNSNSTTYTFPADGGETRDLGVTNNIQYVNAQNVYNKGSQDRHDRIVPIVTKDTDTYRTLSMKKLYNILSLSASKEGKSWTAANASKLQGLVNDLISYWNTHYNDISGGGY